MKARKSPNRVNPTRKAKRFAEAYGSKARVAWVKSLPCAYCRNRGLLFRNQHAGESHNAHTESGHGMGYKAGYETIAPLCPRHHDLFDRHVAPFDAESVRYCVRLWARETASAWLAHLAEDGE